MNGPDRGQSRTGAVCRASRRTGAGAGSRARGGGSSGTGGKEWRRSWAGAAPVRWEAHRLGGRNPIGGLTQTVGRT